MMKEANPRAYQRKIVWDHLDDAARQRVLQLGEDYKDFIARAKTERSAVAAIAERAKANGFVALAEAAGPLTPGQGVYLEIKGKALLLAVPGHAPLSEGANIIGAHVDSPRLDLKMHPLYESNGLALWKTHYYGGIKKYHWLAMPLALHGLVYNERGEKTEIQIGEDLRDPVFTITDLLPHLAKDQMEKKLAEAFPGESLNALCAGFPVSPKHGSARVKETVLEILQSRYNLVEEDLVSAELSLVPAWPPRDVGWDRSMIGAYGQDDRICAYTLLRAITALDNPARTAVGIFVDKEEIGSVGNTGMESNLLPDLMAELLEKSGEPDDHRARRKMLRNSRALSADVNVAIDPNFEEVAEKNNAAQLGCGVVLTKYTGIGGKKGSNDAHASYLALIRRIFNQDKVIWQTGELGKIDQGGGGTIAYLMAAHGMDVVDCGTALLGMHSPFEVCHKADLYMTYRGYQAFLQAKTELR